MTLPLAPIERGILRLRAGEHAEAAKIFRREAMQNPSSPDGHHMLGMTYHHQGKPEQAIKHFERAIKRNGNVWQFHQNLGIAYQSVGRFPDAVSAFQHALVAYKGAEARGGADPVARADIYHNLGTAYLATQNYEHAELCLKRAIRANQSYAQSPFNLGCMHLVLGEIREAARWFGVACDRDPAHMLAHANLIFCRDLLPETTASMALAERRAFNTRHCTPLRAEWRMHARPRTADRKIRVGYIGGDFRDHSAMYSFGPIIERHDRARFDVAIYADVPDADPYTERMRAASAVFRPVQGLSEAQIADLVRGDGVDVLVELAGFTARHKLLVLARKPAPVQLSGWGYLNGTGMDAIDGFLVDDVLVPPGDEVNYVERPVYVPHAVGFEPPPFDVPIREREPGAPFTFGHLGRLQKLSELTLDVWADVLAAVPGSRLLLKDRGFDPERVQARIRAAFEKRRIDPARIEMRGSSKRAEHLDTYNEIDVALDPMPQGGGTTTLEALWMGVPVVAMVGERITGRVSAAHLRRLGTWPPIPRDRHEYVEQAVDLAGRPGEKGPWLRDALLGSLVSDHDTLARAVEAGYIEMVQRWAERERAA